MPCLVISFSGPTPDRNKICGDPNAPDDKITSLVALKVKVLFSASIHSTPFAELFSIIILLTWVSVRTVKLSRSRAGTRYAFAALHLFPFICVVW